MSQIFSSLFDCIKRKKGFFIILVLGAIVAIILGVFAGMNFSSGVFTIDLGNIAYIKFLKGDTGFVSMIFSLILSLGIFFLIIVVCGCKLFLIPLGVVFYLYLVYSQTVIFISVIMIYGFFNCIILAVLLLVYILFLIFLYTLVLTECVCIMRGGSYFKTCINLRECKVLIYFLLVIIATLVFTIIITILKSYVILLIY
ncbi:MAG: hypothetical protein E7351_01670 [Clostridiales bacterium]|nr:hypothetical protein [Clostridiales bacterium]